MITVSRKISFCAGHRLVGHEGQCAYFHGHNYVAYFYAAPEHGEELDKVGRVIDFSLLKERLGGWINRHWDHSFLLYDQDEEGISILRQLANQPLFLLSSNPTAENMARYLLEIVGPAELKGTGVKLIKVELWETENCFAEACCD